MSANGRLGLGAAEVILITSKLERDDAAFIIGGQATNLWAWFYRDRDPILSAPLTSEDIEAPQKVRVDLPKQSVVSCYYLRQEVLPRVPRS